MKAILFGASGMVGQGILRELLLDPGVERVICIVRTPSGKSHPKLIERVQRDFSAIGDDPKDYDACFWAVGVTSAGMAESDYSRITHELTMSVAHAIAHPRMTFVFVSAFGADSTEKGRTMWGRVKGRTENDLARLPFKATYAVRPAYIHPMHGVTSRTKIYRMLIPLVAPLYPLLKKMFPRHVTTTETLGRAMIRLARDGAAERVIEVPAINRLGAVAS